MRKYCTICEVGIETDRSRFDGPTWVPLLADVLIALSTALFRLLNVVVFIVNKYSTVHPSLSVSIYLQFNKVSLWA